MKESFLSSLRGGVEEEFRVVGWTWLGKPSPRLALPCRLAGPVPCSPGGIILHALPEVCTVGQKVVALLRGRVRGGRFCC